MRSANACAGATSARLISTSDPATGGAELFQLTLERGGKQMVRDGSARNHHLLCNRHCEVTTLLNCCSVLVQLCQCLRCRVPWTSS